MKNGKKLNKNRWTFKIKTISNSRNNFKKQQSIFVVFNGTYLYTHLWGR